jgi:hypothetical protein
MGEASSSKTAKRQRPASGGEGKRLGWHNGSPGRNRMRHLAVGLEHADGWDCCVGCGCALSAAHRSHARNAHRLIDLVCPRAAGAGLVLQQTKLTYLGRPCDCGHWRRAQPGRGGDGSARRVAPGRPSWESSSSRWPSACAPRGCAITVTTDGG